LNEKISKGFISLLAIKLSIVFLIVLVESCKKESSAETHLLKARENFLSVANSNIKKMGNIKLSKYGVNSLKTNSLSTNSELYTEDASILLYRTSIEYEPEISLGNDYYFGDLVRIPFTEIGVLYRDGSITDNISGDSEAIATFVMPEETAQNMLQSSLVEAKNYLKANGFSDNDLAQLLAADSEGPAIDESALIPTVMVLIAEQQNQDLGISQNIHSYLFNSAKASRIGACASNAFIGVDISAISIAGLYTEAGKKIVKTALRKAATRTLGWVGAAIFVYEFGDCMKWW
jgi:hypothetical protein